jgi:SAM-dependent methyltransferase
MRNPWLDIPAADYVGHMASADVDQLGVLSRLLREALATFRPRDFLLLGCSTGNGLEHIDAAVTRCVTGVDINPEYLRQLSGRYGDVGFQLTLHCGDVATWASPVEGFDLAHCALLFEYMDWSALLPRLARTLRSKGGLTVVLQRPSKSGPAVTRTAFTSLRRLDSLFRFVDPDAVVAGARASGFELQDHRIESLNGGKAFVVLALRKTAPSQGTAQGGSQGLGAL